jgi:hypothetical protein
MTATEEHGTRRGYDAHARAGTEPCGPCASAKSDSTQAHKVRSGKTLAIRVPVEVLGDVLLRLDEDVLDRVSDAVGHEVTAACMELAAWTALEFAGSGPMRTVEG